jgi:hypothetical protein
MASVDPVWAAWTEDAIRVHRFNPRTRSERVRCSTHASLRYFVRLSRQSRALLLRSADGDAVRFDVANGDGAFERIPGWPTELACLPPYRVFPLEDGSFAGLPEQPQPPSVVLWKPGARVVNRPLPSSFSARALARDEHGRHYVAGSIATKRLLSTDTRPAFAVSADRGASWQVDEKAHGQLVTAVKSVLFGGATEYRSVTAERGWVVLSAESGELGEESTLVFARSRTGHWSSGVLHEDVFRESVVLGDGTLEILSHRGRGLKFDVSGRRRERNWVPRIDRVIRCGEVSPPPDAQYELLAADALETDISLLVSIQSGAPPVRFGEAIVVLGATADRVVHVERAPAPEIVTLCS